MGLGTSPEPPGRAQHVVYASGVDLIELYFFLDERQWQVGRPRQGTPAPNVWPTAPLTAWIASFSQHIGYLSDNGHLNELAWNYEERVWEHRDVTVRASAAPASLGSGLTSWADSPPDRLFARVAYLGPPGVKDVLLFSAPQGTDSWAMQDLSSESHASEESPGPAGQLTSWIDKNFQHVVYTSGDGTVHELYAAPGESGFFIHNNLSEDLGALPEAATAAELTSWADSGYQHVVYVSRDGHLRALRYALGAGLAWEQIDLTEKTDAPPADWSRGLTSWIDRGTTLSQTRYEHVSFVSAVGEVWELYSVAGENSWSKNNLSVQTQAPDAHRFSRLTSWFDPSESRPCYQHVVYVDTDLHLQEFYLPITDDARSWDRADLTSSTVGGPAPPAEPTSLTSWVDDFTIL
jgi:hypothetical protein